MRELTKELYFRLVYSVLCIFCLSGIYYFTYGWQWEYINACFCYVGQSPEYCFKELLDWECLQNANFVKFTETQNPIIVVIGTVPKLPYAELATQAWSELFLTHHTYFYGLILKDARFLLNAFLISHSLGWCLLQNHGWFCSGQVHGRLTRQITGIWIVYHLHLISAGLTLLIVNEEFAIETLDSELINTNK